LGDSTEYFLLAKTTFNTARTHVCNVILHMMVFKLTFPGHSFKVADGPIV